MGGISAISSASVALVYESIGSSSRGVSTPQNLNALGAALESGNLAAAEVAFSSLQTALQIAGHSGAGHVVNVTV